MRQRLTFANVVSVLALFVALGGSSYAALKITGKDVRNASLTGLDVRNSSLTGRDVRNRSLLANDFKSGQLPRGPSGAAGATGPRGAQGLQGPPGLQGTPGQSALEPLGSGETVRGVIGGGGFSTAGGHGDVAAVTLPVPAPVALDGSTVLVDVDDDPLNSCTGTDDNPTAPPGSVCIYLNFKGNVTSIVGDVPHAEATRFGFVMFFDATASGDTNIQGTWAYTAP